MGVPLMKLDWLHKLHAENPSMDKEDPKIRELCGHHIWRVQKRVPACAEQSDTPAAADQSVFLPLQFRSFLPLSLSLHSEIRGRGDRRKRYDIGMLISPDWEGGFRIQTDRQTHSARRAQAAPNLPLKNARPDRQNGEISYQPINWNSKAHDTHNLSSGVVLSKTATPFDDLFIKLPKLFKLKLKAQIW